MCILLDASHHSAERLDHCTKRLAELIAFRGERNFMGEVPGCNRGREFSLFLLGSRQLREEAGQSTEQLMPARDPIPGDVARRQRGPFLDASKSQ